MTNQPIEEKWKIDFRNRYYSDIVLNGEKIPKHEINVSLLEDQESFIENLLTEEVQKCIEEIYSTGEYDFGNGSKISIRESGIFPSFIENLLEQERHRLGWKTHDCSEMLSTEIENAVEQEKRRMSEEIKDMFSVYPDGELHIFSRDEELVPKKKVLSIINK